MDTKMVDEEIALKRGCLVCILAYHAQYLMQLDEGIRKRGATNFSPLRMSKTRED